MSKSIGRFLRHAVVVASSCLLSAGPAPADANLPGASLTGTGVGKHEERVPTATPALSLGRGARDRLADFFERTRGGMRVISAAVFAGASS